MEEQGSAFGSSKLKREEKIRADRRIREEQDRAYNAALKQDKVWSSVISQIKYFNHPIWYCKFWKDKSTFEHTTIFYNFANSKFENKSTWLPSRRGKDLKIHLWCCLRKQLMRGSNRILQLNNKVEWKNLLLLVKLRTRILQIQEKILIPAPRYITVQK